MPPLRQRLVHAAWRSRSLSREFSRRGSAAMQQQGPVHRLLWHLYRFSRRHPVTVNQWDAQYAGHYAEGLDSIGNVPHHMVIVGYLACGAKEQPKILDVGCGHGRLLQLLAGISFADYVGVEWSGEAVQRARSFSIPHTRFEVADMDHWDTSERFDAVVLNECLTYSVDPRQMFERTLEWLTEDGVVIVSMFRGLGTRYIWSRVHSAAVEQLAACTVKDGASGGVWDVKALRPRPANLAIGSA